MINLCVCHFALVRQEYWCQNKLYLNGNERKLACRRVKNNNTIEAAPVGLTLLLAQKDLRLHHSDSKPRSQCYQESWEVRLRDQVEFSPRVLARNPCSPLQPRCSHGPGPVPVIGSYPPSYTHCD
ncbi:hypothetical protein RRG08_044964 [Elysia crispata]|uniref:Uncharacterized protein n=1 Tax=Elysia crispata TaxID=231223 RepID=A0AAE1DMW3_9GAST|nr:hypothetical protein RRG08_044964 [Elysia crispata]